MDSFVYDYFMTRIKDQRSRNARLWCPWIPFETAESYKPLDFNKSLWLLLLLNGSTNILIAPSSTFIYLSKAIFIEHDDKKFQNVCNLAVETFCIRRV